MAWETEAAERGLYQHQDGGEETDADRAPEIAKALALKWADEIGKACPADFPADDFAELCRDALADETWDRFETQADKDFRAAALAALRQKPAVSATDMLLAQMKSIGDCYVAGINAGRGIK
jgi:hypothetical protein